MGGQGVRDLLCCAARGAGAPAALVWGTSSHPGQKITPRALDTSKLWGTVPVSSTARNSPGGSQFRRDAATLPAGTQTRVCRGVLDAAAATSPAAPDAAVSLFRSGISDHIHALFAARRSVAQALSDILDVTNDRLAGAGTGGGDPPTPRPESGPSPDSGPRGDGRSGAAGVLPLAGLTEHWRLPVTPELVEAWKARRGGLRVPSDRKRKPSAVMLEIERGARVSKAKTPSRPPPKKAWPMDATTQRALAAALLAGIAAAERGSCKLPGSRTDAELDIELAGSEGTGADAVPGTAVRLGVGGWCQLGSLVLEPLGVCGHGASGGLCDSHRQGLPTGATAWRRWRRHTACRQRRLSMGLLR